ncbi:high mobility group protein B2-like isoform X3 [Watersipora subatra]|uniref:high mobility group protein B2-like isoform X3 n=1 Tax=Watersipora subatra TaxID=2589382 RepID=UPI00355C5873
MPPRKDASKPKGAMTSYAAFVQVCRDEHKRKHPDDQIVFAEFSKKCSERWRSMSDKEKKRFEDIAAKDKARYQREMAGYVPPAGDTGNKRKAKKDPNAPKRALSAFFFFCGEFRGQVKEKNPDFTVGDIAKELGKRWEKVTDKSKYEKMAADDKVRYEKAMLAYNKGAAASSAKKSRATVPSDDESEEDSD